MPSLEQRFTDFIESLKRLGREPSLTEVNEADKRLDALNYELRTTVAAGERYDDLVKRGIEAAALIVDARSRAERARNLTQAVADRQRHAVEHPTELSPPSAQLNAFARAAQEQLSQRERPGYER